MIAFVRAVSVKPGKQREAMTFAKEIAAYFKANHHVDMEVLTPVGGNPQRIAWSTRYPDMATMETLGARYLADAKYWELVEGASDTFIGGSTRDAIWKTA